MKLIFDGKPKIKVILAIIINVFAIAILLAILFTPLGKLGTSAKAADTTKYGSQWKITRVHWIKVIARDYNGGGRDKSLGKIAVGASQYEVKYCIGDQGVIDEFQRSGNCAPDKTIKEIWDVVGEWHKPTITQEGAVVDNAMFKVESGDATGSDGIDTDDSTVTNGPLAVSAGKKSGNNKCYQEGSVTRSGPYGISFNAQENHVCTTAEYKTAWSYSEFPMRWKVTATGSETYEAQWLVATVSVLDVEALGYRGHTAPGLVGRIATGPASYIVKYCIGGQLTGGDATHFGTCSTSDVTEEEWLDQDYSMSAHYGGWGETNGDLKDTVVVKGAMFSVNSESVEVGDPDLTNGNITNGPLFVSNGLKTDPTACYQEGLITSSGLYSISFNAHVNRTCSTYNYLDFWSYAEFPMRWETSKMTSDWGDWSGVNAQ